MATGTGRVQATVEGSRVVADHAGEGDEAVLCVHGLASQRASLRPLVEALADRGFRALAPDLRGHGDSDGPRGRISRRRALADLAAWHELLVDDGARLRAIVGHSLGGFWAMAGQRALDADAVALVATPVSIRRELSWLERGAYRVGAGLQRLASPLGLQLRVPYRVGLEDVLETDEAVQVARRTELVQDWIPLANAADLLALDGIALARALTSPAIVAHPTRDRLVDRDSTRALYEAIGTERTWLELEGPHECFFDVTGGACAEELVDAVASLFDGTKV